jgi:hypothetical protein
MIKRRAAGADLSRPDPLVGVSEALGVHVVCYILQARIALRPFGVRAHNAFRSLAIRHGVDDPPAGEVDTRMRIKQPSFGAELFGGCGFWSTLAQSHAFADVPG